MKQLAFVRRCACRRIALGIVAWGLLSAAQAAPELPILWEENYGLGLANSPVGVDIGFDGRPEVILTDNEGRIAVIDAESGRALWQERERASLSEPLIGNFRGQGTLELLVGGSDGVIRLFSPASGAVLARIEAGIVPSVSPTLLPADSGMPGATDRFILVEDSGHIVCGQIAADGAFEIAWEYQMLTQSRAPVAVGNLIAAGDYDVVVADFNGVVTILDGATGQALSSYQFAANSNIACAPALAQLEGSAEDEILVATERGYLHALRLTPAKRIEPIWASAVRILGNPLEAVAALDLNGDYVSDAVTAFHGDIVFVDGLSSDSFRASVNNPPIKTPPAIMQGRDGLPYLFVIDDQGTLYGFVVNGRSPSIIGENRTGGDFIRTPVVLAAGPEQKVVVFAISTSGGQAYCFGTPLTATAGPVLWQTAGGSLLHSGNRGARAAERLQAQAAVRQSTLARLLQEMEQAVAAGDWRVARDKAEDVLIEAPGHETAAAVRAKANFRLHLHWYVAGVILGAIAAFLIGRPLYRAWWRKSRLHKGEEAVRQGDFDEAGVLYQRLRERYPQDKDVNAQLAVLYMKQGDYSPDTIPVYERMYQHSPDNLPVLQALARAYLASRRQDDQALEVFVKVSDQFDEPGRLNHALGEIYHARGDDQSALAFLRKAMREEYRPHEMILLLADVYLNLGVRASASIPIYEAAWASRPQDSRLLTALAESYAARQQADPQSEEAYERLLELNPEHEAVRLMLGRIKLRQGAHDEAIRHAQVVLDQSPESEAALNVQAQACIAAARSDDEAVAIYRRAAAIFPDDAALLKSIAFVFMERGLEDEEALAVIGEAFTNNPDDTPLAQAVYNLGRRRSDEALTLKAAESLAHAGEASPEVWNTLARIYCDRGSRGEMAEEALRQAMDSEQPCDERVPEVLGAIYAEAGRKDASALHVYEVLSQKGKLDPAVGARFVQALLETGRVSDAATHARALLKRHPRDEGLQRLVARASMESDEVDEAMRQYEALLEGHPDDPEAVVQLARAYARKNRLDDTAMLLYAHAQQVAPHEPLFPIMKARTLAETGNWPATAEALRETAGKGEQAAEMVRQVATELLRSSPSALPMRWLAFQLAFGFGDGPQALEHLVAIQERDPKQTPQVVESLGKLIEKTGAEPLAQFHLGRMLGLMGRLDEARASLEAALESMPGDPKVQGELAKLYDQILKESPAATESDEMRFRLGRLSINLKNYDKAIQCFQACAQDFRYETESVKGLAQCFMAKGMLDLALQEFKKLHIDDEVKEMLYALGQRYENKHDLVGAKTVYRQLFAADIGFRNVREKFEMLAGQTSDPLVFEKTSILNSLSDEAKRRYELIEEIGRGAMGIVYKANDNELQEVVALKILPDNLSNNPEALRRFKAEARSARRLSHPNIVRIHDIGEEMGRKYISMEFIEGTDLKKRLRRKGLPSFDETLAYARQVCAAIAYAHDEGIVHRDIKPANIMVAKDERIKVTDFGIAKVCESQDATLAGAIMGTPLYMSPEQVQGVVVDNRSDIYSLGILFYELINGRPPFTEGDLAYQHLHVAPKPLDKAPAAFWSVIDKALKKNRDERWATVEEMLSALMKAD